MASNIHRRNLLKGIGAAGIVGLAGCVGDDDDDGDDDDGDDDSANGIEEIRLGILMGVTGGLEEVGPPIRDSAELVAQQINDGDTDIEVDSQFEDTGTDSTEGISGAQALINAGYPMVCGALASDVSLAVAEGETIPNRIPMCSPASTAPEYTDLEGDFNFRTAVPDSFQGQVMAEIARDRFGVDTAAAIGQDDAYGRGLVGAFVDSFEELGGTITDDVIFTMGESSYTAQLTNALDGDPELLMVVGFPEDGVQLFQDFYSDFDRHDMPVIVSDGLQSSGLPDDVGYDMSNVTGTVPIGEGPGVDFFSTLFEDTYEESPAGQPFVRQAYDAAATLVLAHAAAGESDGEAVRDAIRPVTDSGGEEVTPENLVEGVELAAEGEDIEYRGVSGEISYDENGDQADVAYEYFGYTEAGDIEQLDIISLD